MSVRKLVPPMVFLWAFACWGQPQPHSKPAGHKETPLPPEIQSVLNAITAGNLRGDLSFLASDTLQGRYTPSPGLDVAAEFIASQFRAAGLEPGGPDFFQIAEMVDRRLPRLQTEMVIADGDSKASVAANAMTVVSVNHAAHIEHASVLVFPARDPELLKGKDLAGKAVVVPEPDFQKLPKDQVMSVYDKLRDFDAEVGSSQAALEITVGQGRGRYSDGRLIPAEEAEGNRAPVLKANSEELRKWIDHPAEGRTVTLDIPAPEDRKVSVKNVIGIMRGSDPVLKDTCVLVTAHYDHIGTVDTAGHSALATKGQNTKDRIFNGANDDGSGTVSVIEIARALAKLKRHPKRSIVFMTFFGEERGELGSQYYGKHPVFPISKTVADVNLEQVGRTDSTNGPQVNSASLTGFDYSDVTKYFINAGRETGIKVYLDKEASDAYFVRSDNAALAEQGVPAHTLTVAFDYPDYHGLGDEWQKIDYDNMARVDRMIALGVWRVANHTIAPQWNASNPSTAPFREAQKKLAATR